MYNLMETPPTPIQKLKLSDRLSNNARNIGDTLARKALAPITETAAYLTLNSSSGSMADGKGAHSNLYRIGIGYHKDDISKSKPYEIFEVSTVSKTLNPNRCLHYAKESFTSKMKCIIGVSNESPGIYKFAYIHDYEDSSVKFYKYNITTSTGQYTYLTPAEIQSRILSGEKIQNVSLLSLNRPWGGSKRTTKRKSRSKRTSKRRNKSITRRHRK